MKTKTISSPSTTTRLSKSGADLFLNGGTVINVYSGELLKWNVAVKGERIWFVGPHTNMINDDTIVVDVKNKFIVPGYIDPHFHPWFIYNPISFGQAASLLGITTLFCDNLMFYMLMGIERFEHFMEVLWEMPIKYFWFCRAVPQTPMPRENSLFSLKNLKRLLANPYVQSVGEITRWPEVITGNEKIRKIIKHAKDLKKRVDGHTAGAKYDQLVLLSRAGIESCHEAITAQEALERLRLGMYVILRESSLRQDLRELLRIVTENKVLTDHLMLTTDCSGPSFYQEFGILNNVIRIAIEAGLDPIQVYKMVTINPAVYFGMEHELGGIAPGRFADMLVLSDLQEPTPEVVISRGRILVNNYHLIEPYPAMDWDQFFTPSCFYDGSWSARPSILVIRSRKRRVKLPVISLINAVITRLEWMEFDTHEGVVNLRKKPEYSFICLIDREGHWVTKGIIKGFANVEGFASSFNTAAHILAIGRNPAAIAAAVNRVLEAKGGVVAIEKDQVVYELALPLGGIMSDKPMNELAVKERELKAFLTHRGYRFHDPFYTLVFLPNDFLPEVRINYQGIVNIKTNEVLYPRNRINL